MNRSTRAFPFRVAGAIAATTSSLILGLVASPAMAAPPEPANPSNESKVAGRAAPVPYVVGMGDSYMSGEAGEWATDSPNYLNNTGWQVGTPTQIYGHTAVQAQHPYRACHRSPSAAMVFPSANWKSANIACSGATTQSQTEPGNFFKPGIDFATTTTPYGRANGQALMLQNFARSVKTTNPVRAITLSIGGNDAHFAAVLQNCLEQFLEAPFGSYCRSLPYQQQQVTPAATTTLQAKIQTALTNIKTAMTNAGYATSSYRVIYQMPPAPIPPGANMYWRQTPLRQTSGGCGFYDWDVQWLLNNYAGVLKTAMTNASASAASGQDPMNISLVDNTNLLNSHRLCDYTAAQNRMNGFGQPTPATRNTTEWIRVISVIDAEWWEDKYPDRPQEAMHPMYWGQRALAGCNAAAAGKTAPGLTSYACTLTGAWTPSGQPQVNLVAVPN